MNKIYKVNTFEKLEYLLNTLHKRGAKWSDGCSLDDKDMMVQAWDKYGLEFKSCNGLVIYNENNSIKFSSLSYLYNAIKQYEMDGEEYIIIEDVKLPKPSEKPKVTEIYFHDDTGGKLGGDRIFRVTEEIQVQPHQPNVIQPGHYNQGDMDLFEIFYHQYPFNEFRTGMRMIAARYYHRYPDKNGLQDYDKGDEVMRHLREYEEREANGR
jgi:hypothetical protein|nr:MAG TPA: hypothetical protein [Caudoviricetes sp.]